MRFQHVCLIRHGENSRGMDQLSYRQRPIRSGYSY